MFIHYSMRSLNPRFPADAWRDSSRYSCRFTCPGSARRPERSCAMNTPVAPSQVAVYGATQVATEPHASHPMPEIAAFVASLKAAFGAAVINDAIQRGKAG